MSAYLYPSKDQVKDPKSKHFNQPIGTTWRYRAWVKDYAGNRVKIGGTPDINNKQSALIAERKHIERIQKAPSAIPAVDPTTSGQTFGAYAVTWLDMVAAMARNKPSEITSKRSILNTHLIPAWGLKPLGGVSTSDVNELTGKLYANGAGISKKRINNILHVASKLFKDALEADLINSLPRIKGYVLPKSNKLSQDQFFSFSDYEKLVEASRAEPAWLAAILLAGDAGLRMGEIIGLKWDAINIKAAHLNVCRSVWRGVEGVPKGRESRTVPMTARLTTALKALGQSQGLVFHHEDGTYLTLTNMRAGIKRQEKRAGVKVTGWHLLRHTFCSHLAMRGAPPKAIQELAGHTTIAVTDRYMHIAPEALRSAIGLLEPTTQENLGQQVDKGTKKAS